MGATLRPLALMGAIVVGYVFPQAAICDWAIPWLVRLMLFIVFLRLEFRNLRLRRGHFAILTLNFCVGVGSCATLKLLGYDELAMAAFFTGIAPTATAAPAIATFLKRDVEYIVTGLLLTTFGVSVALPTLLPWAVGEATPGAFWRVAGNVSSVIVAPIVAALLVRGVWPNVKSWAKRLKDVAFGAWITMVVVIAAQATTFIGDPKNAAAPTILFEIGAISLAVCAFNFAAGYLVGDKGLRSSATQTLGQKNTGVVIYFATLYANPLVALGPTFYVFWQNAWNSAQLAFVAFQERRAAKNENPTAPEIPAANEAKRNARSTGG